ncbi:MAG: DUF1573 domain-containing protein [Ferruginibacter sp.]
MKRFFTLALCSFAFAAVHAQQDGGLIVKQADTKPVAVPVEALSMKEAEFNFGKIPQGKPVTHVFEISNISKDSLKIVNVQASCGCTTPEWEKDKVMAPGTSSKITVGYNAAAEGPFNKPVTITYNGGQTKVIFIKGEVWRTPPASAPENKALGDLKD